MQRNNLGLKIIALILAIVSWFYISGELNKGQPGNSSVPRPPIMPKP